MAPHRQRKTSTASNTQVEEASTSNQVTSPTGSFNGTVDKKRQVRRLPGDLDSAKEIPNLYNSAYVLDVLEEITLDYLESSGFTSDDRCEWMRMTVKLALVVLSVPSCALKFSDNKLSLIIVATIFYALWYFIWIVDLWVFDRSTQYYIPEDAKLDVDGSHVLRVSMSIDPQTDGTDLQVRISAPKWYGTAPDDLTLATVYCPIGKLFRNISGGSKGYVAMENVQLMLEEVSEAMKKAVKEESVEMVASKTK